MTIKPIETVYNGYRFRSRLEARWAVFFDAMGYEYRYEEQGFDLDGDWYLPDFVLLNFSFPTWVEIKGRKPSEKEIDLASKLSDYGEGCVYIFAGDCWFVDHVNNTMLEFHSRLDTRPVYLLACAACNCSAFCMNESKPCDCGSRMRISSPRLQNAYLAARQARFEHGASGARFSR